MYGQWNSSHSEKWNSSGAHLIAWSKETMPNIRHQFITVEHADDTQVDWR